MSKLCYIAAVVIISFLVCWQSYSIHKARWKNDLSVALWESTTAAVPQNKSRFLLNEEGKCSGRSPFLLLLIPTAPDDSSTRDVVRKTWGDENLVPGVEIMRIFLVGVSQSANVFSVRQALLKNESATYGDIIQQDFLDTYHNLTLKTLMGMEWVATFCPSASYVVKIDSDMFFNPVYLIKNLLQPSLPVKKNYFTGWVIRWARPYRDKNNKWYVPQEVYAKDYYPTYCSGTGYVLSADLATKIYKVSPFVAPITMEDVFMGLCVEKLGIDVTVPPRNLFHGHRLEYERCKFTKLITVHHYKKEELRRHWSDFLKALKTC